MCAWARHRVERGWERFFVQNISPSNFFRFFSNCRSQVDLIQSLTVAEAIYGQHIPVEDIVQDVIQESARNFLQSELVIVISQTRCHLTVRTFRSTYKKSFFVNFSLVDRFANIARRTWKGTFKKSPKLSWPQQPCLSLWSRLTEKCSLHLVYRCTLCKESQEASCSLSTTWTLGRPAREVNSWRTDTARYSMNTTWLPCLNAFTSASLASRMWLQRWGDVWRSKDTRACRAVTWYFEFLASLERNITCFCRVPIPSNGRIWFSKQLGYLTDQ